MRPVERLGRREAHALLLQRQPQLLRERAVELLGREAQRADEADAGLDRDDEQVDQLGQRLVDLVVALLDAAARMIDGSVPAEAAPRGRCRAK